METLAMTRGEMLKPEQVKDFLREALRENADISLSFTHLGKWHLHHSQICQCDEETLFLKEESSTEDIIENQPVGICVHLGRFNYLFESTIKKVETNRQGGRVSLDIPDKVERVQRRAFERQPVPASIKVKCLFWHRGYLDDSERKPAEQYWQGRLLNLSAGGAQIAVDLALKPYFSQGQLVGVQFTPMSYQRPLLLEAHVKYLVDQSEQNQFLVGVEFLGLETGIEGREVLHRLIQIINEYEKLNQQGSSNSPSAS